jgi:hypothetical protein
VAAGKVMRSQEKTLLAQYCCALVVPPLPCAAAEADVAGPNECETAFATPVGFVKGTRGSLGKSVH